MKRLFLFALTCLAVSCLFGQNEIFSTDSLIIEDPSSELGPTYFNTSSTSDTVGKKLVFWIHGLAGNAYSWGRVQLVTEAQTTPIPGYPPRNVEGMNVDYSGGYPESLPILDLGLHVNSLMETWRNALPRRTAIPVSKNFAIVHSQGGIVARAVKYVNAQNYAGNYPSQFSHFASFGSPHGGAYIINSSANGGPVIDWLKDGCKALAPALVKDFLKDSPWWLDGIITPGFLASITNIACDGLSKTVVPLLIKSIRKPVAEDYAVGAGKLINTLRPFAVSDTVTRVVNFYGVEEEPVFWRVLHTMTQSTDTNTGHTLLRNDPFGYVEDQGFPDRINNKYHSFIAEKNRYNTIARNRAIFAAWLWPTNAGIGLGLMAFLAHQKAKTFDEAADWLGNANLQWKEYIGATRDSVYLDGNQCDCLYNDPNNGYAFSSTVVQNPADCDSSNTALSCNITPRNVHIRIEEPNDGVVTVSSQAAYPGRKLGLEMVKTNHMQERNHRQTKYRLRELFDGRLGREFKLDEQ